LTRKAGILYTHFMSPDDKDRVDWVVPGNGDFPLGTDDNPLVEINRRNGYLMQPTEKDPISGKIIRARVDRVVVEGMPAPQPAKKK
jgi:hypothetical protein